MDSILTSIKKLLGIDESYEAFDDDIIFHINMTLNILYQLGVEKQFVITGIGETWEDYLQDRKDLELIKSYIYMKVRKAFDPPKDSTMESLDRMISELEWRISVTVDPGEE